MKIEVGKYYRTAEGEVRGPLRITKQYPDRFTDEQGNWYGDDGHYWRQRPDCRFRLVVEEPAPPIKRKRRHEAMLEQGMHAGNTDAKFDPPPEPTPRLKRRSP